MQMQQEIIEEINSVFTLKDLKNVCKKLGLQVAGLKSDLIIRILNRLKIIPNVEQTIRGAEMMTLMRIVRRRRTASTGGEEDNSSSSTSIPRSSLPLLPPPSPSLTSLQRIYQAVRQVNLPMMLGVIGGLHAIWQICIGQTVEVHIGGGGWW